MGDWVSVRHPLKPIQPVVLGKAESTVAIASGDKRWRAQPHSEKTCERLELPSPVAGNISRGITPSSLLLPLHPLHQARQVIALIKVKEKPPGSSSWGLIEGGSLSSQTWQKWPHLGLTLWCFLKHQDRWLHWSWSFPTGLGGGG